MNTSITTNNFGKTQPVKNTKSIIKRFATADEAIASEQWKQIFGGVVADYDRKSIRSQEADGSLVDVFVVEGVDCGRPIMYKLFKIDAKYKRPNTYNLLQLSSVGMCTSRPVQLVSVDGDVINYHKAFVAKEKLEFLGTSCQRINEHIIITEP